MNHIFEIDGCHWYSAETAEEAKQLFIADSGGPGQFDDLEDIEQLPDEKPLTVCEVDETDQPKTTKMCREWAESKGFVATTEY